MNIRHRIEQVVCSVVIWVSNNVTSKQDSKSEVKTNYLLILAANTMLTTNELNSSSDNKITLNDSGDALIGTSILDLDDDSLLCVLNYLPLRDKFSFVCTHERFISAFQMYAKASLKEMTQYDLEFLTPQEINYFFKHAGEYLHTLTLKAGFEQERCFNGFTLVKLYCQNLKKLSLWGNLVESDKDFERFRELLSNKPNLRILRLQRLLLKDVNMDLMLESELPKLEHLSIVYCKEFAGFSLKKFANIRKLRLENLQKLDYTAVRNALTVMPNLQAFSYLEAETPDDRRFVEVLNGLQHSNKELEILELNMHNTRSVNVSNINKLKHFTYGIRDNSCLTTIDLTKLLSQRRDQLESLRFVSFWDFQFSSEDCQLISQFRNLKKLHLPWKDLSKHGIRIDDESLEHLSALEHLVEFKACGENSFTKNGLLNLVQRCRQLKWVNIQCSLIDNKFARELLPVLEEEENRPNGRITFLVYNSKMNKSKFPVEYSSIEMQQKAVFIFDELFALETYNNFYDDFEHDSNFVRTPFCSYC